MVDATTAVNAVGIAFTIIGVYANSPINHMVIDGGDASTDWSAIERRANRRNTLLRVGIYIVLAGSFLQLVSNFVSAGSAAVA